MDFKIHKIDIQPTINDGFIANVIGEVTVDNEQA